MKALLSGGLSLSLLVCVAAAPAQDWRPVTAGSRSRETSVQATVPKSDDFGYQQQPAAASGTLAVTLKRPIPLSAPAEPRYETHVQPVAYSEVRIQRPQPLVFRANIDMPRPLPAGATVGQVIPGEAAELRLQSELPPRTQLPDPQNNSATTIVPQGQMLSGNYTVPGENLVPYGGDGFVYGGGEFFTSDNCGCAADGMFYGEPAMIDGGCGMCETYGGGIIDGGYAPYGGGCASGMCGTYGTYGGTCGNYGGACGNYGGTCGTYGGTCGTYGGTCGTSGGACGTYGGSCGAYGGTCDNSGTCGGGGCGPDGTCGGAGCGPDGMACRKPLFGGLFKSWHNCGQEGCGASGYYGQTGCDNRFGYRRPCFWAGGEYLNWRLSEQNLPTLVVTDTAPARILFDRDTLNNDNSHGGARAYMGFWCAHNPCCGFDVNWFYLGREQQSNQFANGPAIAFIPAPVAFDAIRIDSTQYMWGLDANFRKKLNNRPNCYCDLLLGYRHLQLEESLTIAATDGGTLLRDRYQTSNRFNGGQIGLDSEYRFLPKWSIGGTVKVALGSSQQSLRVRGAGTLIAPGGDETFTRNGFAVVPEGQVRLVHDLSEKWRIHVGYNILGISDVLRPGDHVNTSGGQPAILLQSESVIVHGLNVGLTCIY